MMEVYEDLDQYIDEQKYDVSAFGFDPYNAKEFRNQVGAGERTVRY